MNNSIGTLIKFENGKCFKKVFINYSPKPISFSRDIECHVNEIWNQKKKENSNLFDGESLVLTNFKESLDSITLICQPLPYRYFIAKQEGIGIPYSAVGISGITFYSDKGGPKYCVGLRSSKVTQYPNKWEFAPAGSLEPKINQDGNPSPLHQFRSELKEEMGIFSEQIKNLNIIGIIYDPGHHVLDIILECELNSDHFLKNSEYQKLEFLSEKELKIKFNNDFFIDVSMKSFKTFLSRGEHQ